MVIHQFFNKFLFFIVLASLILFTFSIKYAQLLIAFI